MIRALLALLFAAPAFAGPLCLPTTDEKSQAASPLYAGISRNGAWVYWYCYLPTFSDEYPSAVQLNVYVGTPAELDKVGARVQTMLKAPDTLESLQNAGKRFKILPLTDPSLAAVVRDMRKDRVQ
jgi:hypothetical protein